MSNDLKGRASVFYFNDYFDKPSSEMNVDIQLIVCRVAMEFQLRDQSLPGSAVFGSS
ncbi:hypothetical protein OQJ02_11155 [Legionella sp. PATHC032]|uniref:hypothetical protein n=1 Tax=Legionella sp. PATHC032 TaxID=2992039 RepID=UPI001B017DED|nr:hypothetical protein [Legionella sp. PATHC032]MCW8422188.1 hypothetical protein [Legionella sp. PATHC032]HAZ7572660.1 hypothetical protein [Legionella pneumophila]HBA1634965.1 hypothetical protein [Legionella pneumophila]